MDVSRIRALRGPNLWSRHTAIQAIVTCEGAESAINDLPNFETRLRERFPALGDLIPADHLDTVSMAHALEFAALGRQAQAGCPVTLRVPIKRPTTLTVWPSSSPSNFVLPPSTTRPSTSTQSSRNCAISTRTSASAHQPAP